MTFNRHCRRYIPIPPPVAPPKKKEVSAKYKEKLRHVMLTYICIKRAIQNGQLSYEVMPMPPHVFNSAASMIEYLSLDRDIGESDKIEIKMPVFPFGYDTDRTIWDYIHDKYSMYDRNVYGFPTQWIIEQNEYMCNLAPCDKIKIISYTYHGDKLAKAFMLHDSVIDPTFNIPTFDLFIDEYTRCIYPLALSVYEYMKWSIGFKKCYVQLLEFIYYNHRSLDWNSIISAYIKDVSRIVCDSPVTTTPFYVYRGVYNNNFIKFDARRVFKNISFMSTSLDISVANEFRNNGCCIKIIYIVPGTHCAFIPQLSYYINQHEVLFPPGSLMYPRDKMKAVDKAGIKVYPFFLVDYMPK